MPAANPRHCTNVFHRLPLVLLGVILGNMADENLRRALILHNGSIVPFFTRPISLFFIIFILVLVLPPVRLLQEYDGAGQENVRQKEEGVMRKFDHVGLSTTILQPNERYVAKTKVWVTDPKRHPFCIEWRRYEEDSPVPDLLRSACHVAWHVDDISVESTGLKVILSPFDSVAGHRVGFFQTQDGAIVELMEYTEVKSDV